MSHPSVLCASIDKLGGSVTVDAFKLPHHGSKNNLDTSLLDRVITSRYLVSTNGARRSHPHDEALARIVHRSIPGTELHFNYATASTARWGE